MGEERKLAAILVADIVGFSRLTAADEEGTLSRLRALRAELFNPAVAAHGGRVVKRTGDGAIVEFRSVVEAVRCALDVTKDLARRNAGFGPDGRIEVRTGIHLGDVVEEADGDLMGDGVNIAARLEGICAPGAICLSEDAWRQVRDKLPEKFVDLGEQELKNIARPMRVFAMWGQAVARPPTAPASPASISRALRESRLPRALVGSVVDILENVARLTGAYAERATRGGRPAIRSEGDVPSAELRARVRRLRRAIRSAAGISRAEWRARHRRVPRPAIIAAAILALLAARACNEWHFSAPPPPAPARGAVLDDRATSTVGASVSS